MLSMDSDFFIYNLQYGYIPLTYLDTELIERDGECFMRAHIYRLDSFVEHFNKSLDYANDEVRLRKELLAVFAVLCGNDYVDSHEVFGSFLATMQSANNNLRLRRTAKRRDSHFGRILDWLTQFSQVDDCVDMLKKFCKKDMAQKVRDVIAESVQDYMLLKQSDVLTQMPFLRYEHNF